ncbi:hypothetical protein PYW08_013217 [Mythimna loreyi]|uniref:Uncharacterized protein n=1 Tax=Mythimna loreyi TaxID=667449 RepID=A0ACC2QGY9_9NEOP|nr:hypothetical protein PYW08_013217 [Mythimna loreyi]
MCNVLDDYLKTYNPDITEFHSDSSDFEGTNSSLFTQRMARLKPPMKTLYPNRKNDSIFHKCNTQTRPVTEDSSKETWGSVTTCISPNGSTIGIKLQKSKKYQVLDSGDQIETIKSKRSVIRHKVLPCLSHIFGRSNSNVKQMSIIKENPAENVNIDNGCQTTRVNREHKMRKLNRRQQFYAAQPVYAVEENIHAKSLPFHRTKITRGPLTTCKAVGNANFENICSLTSSSEEVETHKYFKRKRGKRNKPKHNIVESDIGKEYFERYEGQALKHLEQQYPEKLSPVPPGNDHGIPDHNQQRSKNAGCAPMSSSLNASGIELGTACSGFWEYIVNKINMRMQPQIKKIETTTNTLPFKPCTCKGAHADSSDNCCCPNCNYTSNHSTKDDNTSRCKKDDSTSRCKNVSASTSSDCQVKEKKKKKEKVICKCHETKNVKVGRTRPKEKTRPCQINHDEVTDSLSNKYNGEVLCIHNPPCILINGCLTIPPAPQEEQCTSTDMYSVVNESADTKCSYEDTQSKRTKKSEQCYHEKQPCQNIDAYCQCIIQPLEIKPKSKKTKNESCQYQIPQLLKHLMATNYGIHYHSPPLDVRRQQTTDDESHSDDMHKHQATDIDNYKYWLTPNEIRRQEIAVPDSCRYRQSSLPNETKKQQLSLEDSHEKLRQPIEVKQIKTKQPKQEKIIQSICPHNPPCEVVRTCCKTKIDPKLQNSCVHVPMCENVPVCLMELKNQYKNVSPCECPHKPKCTEVPVCTRNYIVLTAKEEVATQVRPKTEMVCRHVPPCIMIPTCLARVCDSCIPYDAIPDCMHQPMCDMIPACCRKSAKEMVSFRSQYPKHSFFRRWKIH